VPQNGRDDECAGWRCPSRPVERLAVTAAQVREVVGRLCDAGQWKDGDLPVLVVLDAGYDVTRLAFLLADLPVELLGRLRSDRVLYFPPPPQPPGKIGRKPKHGAEFKFQDKATWPAPAVTTTTDTTRYGQALARSWDRLHPLLSRRSAWADHPEGELPRVQGTVIRLQVDHLPGDRDPKPVWLWWSRVGASPADVDRLWRAFLRRFDLERSKPQCCHTCGLVPSPSSPSSRVSSFRTACPSSGPTCRACWRGARCPGRRRPSGGAARRSRTAAGGRSALEVVGRCHTTSSDIAFSSSSVP
jgi:hypothetical protein